MYDFVTKLDGYYWTQYGYMYCDEGWSYILTRGGTDDLVINK